MTQIKVSKQFLEDFNLITSNYEMDKEDIGFLRTKTRDHYHDMKESLSIIAGNIRGRSL